ncbi:MAG TPA: 50S ribosomal protein L35 [Lentisphaeria bacterium]|nr:MAG: 50S ribosomal protein L35 [Lentisphaerae bacterium GWF2_50_93]HCE41917.1 50S ribosomal protein L35 [Lentisphaeria bacterium]
MPKMKTRKCAAKRVKMTGTGKFTHYRAGSRHLKTGKSSKRKRLLSKKNVVRSTEMRRIRSALPYGV